MHYCGSMTDLKAVHQFSFPGCTISSNAKHDKKLDKLAKASSAFSQAAQTCLAPQTPEEAY